MKILIEFSELYFSCIQTLHNLWLTNGT